MQVLFAATTPRYVLLNARNRFPLLIKGVLDPQECGVQFCNLLRVKAGFLFADVEVVT